MATVTLYSGFDFSSPQDWNWVATNATSSNITIESSTYRQTMSGSFTYDANNVAYGTVTSTSFYINNSLN